MPRAKPLDKYPREYFSLLRQGQERAVVIACDNERAAHNLRNDLYSFRSVVMKHGTNDQAVQARNLRLKVKDRNLTVEPIRSIDNERNIESNEEPFR